MMAPITTIPPTTPPTIAPTGVLFDGGGGGGGVGEGLVELDELDEVIGLCGELRELIVRETEPVVIPIS